MEAILARHRRRKAEHIFCFCRPGHSFKADSRQVVALVHDKMPIIFDQVIRRIAIDILRAHPDNRSVGCKMNLAA
jgi:hypothetical protein